MPRLITGSTSVTTIPFVLVVGDNDDFDSSGTVFKGDNTNARRIDTRGDFSYSTGRFTCSVPGYYHITFSLSSNDTDYHMANIKLNGSEVGGSVLNYTQYNTASNEVNLKLSVGDYVEGHRRGSGYDVYQARFTVFLIQ